MNSSFRLTGGLYCQDVDLRGAVQCTYNYHGFGYYVTKEPPRNCILQHLSDVNFCQQLAQFGHDLWRTSDHNFC